MFAHLKRCIAGVAVVMAVALPTTAGALPITATLTGDPRLDNPDNLIINVTITSIDSNSVQWVVDIASPLHPNAKLDEFYFNIAGAAGDFTFDGFSPAGWNITTPASTAGGGNISFLFEALDPAGPPNADDVTNSVNLVFNMHYSGGNITDALFLDSSTSCSTDQVLGCGQLGAHLQSLTVPAGADMSDSGFLLGNYSGDRPPTRIPEPGSIALAGLALIALASASRRRRRS